MKCEVGQVRPFIKANGLYSFASFDGTVWVRVEIMHGSFYYQREADAFARHTFSNYAPVELRGGVLPPESCQDA
ncbi:hypothetical protein V8J38_16845 (plasmid) [Brevundimonas olei]|uniref:KTSC domain-containing protein n=1 Tax=Brevundimonas olei TaxID=657642 RepID=A0ABZ2IGC1_9CAUL